MNKLDPRTRSLLRQAEKVALAGKRAAAVELYEKILAEAPDTDAAWAGLASVLGDGQRKEEAYEKALALNPDNTAAFQGLAILRGEAAPEDFVELVPEETPQEMAEETAVSPKPPPPIADPDPSPDSDELLYTCYRHPNRETGLRCYNCQNPICMDCTRKTPVGYLCPDCYREKEDIFFNAKKRDYIIAPLITLPLSLIVGYLASSVGLFFGFYVIFIGAAVGGGVGALIGRLAKRAVGNRRGRYLPHTVAAMIILGFLLPALPSLLFGNIGGLLVPGILLFFATGAAFYAMR